MTSFLPRWRPPYQHQHASTSLSQLNSQQETFRRSRGGIVSMTALQSAVPRQCGAFKASDMNIIIIIIIISEIIFEYSNGHLWQPWSKEHLLDKSKFMNIFAKWIWPRTDPDHLVAVLVTLYWMFFHTEVDCGVLGLLTNEHFGYRSRYHVNVQTRSGLEAFWLVWYEQCFQPGTWAAFRHLWLNSSEYQIWRLWQEIRRFAIWKQSPRAAVGFTSDCPVLPSPLTAELQPLCSHADVQSVVLCCGSVIRDSRSLRVHPELKWRYSATRHTMFNRWDAATRISRKIDTQ